MYFANHLRVNQSECAKSTIHLCGIYCGELAEGKRSQGGQKNRYKDCLKASLKSFDIDVETWETLALDRPAWRSKVNKGTVLFEQNRIAGAQRKRELRKSKVVSLPPAQEIHQCLECGRTFLARIGLISHSRKHRTKSLPT